MANVSSITDLWDGFLSQKVNVAVAKNREVLKSDHSISVQSLQCGKTVKMEELKAGEK